MTKTTEDGAIIYSNLFKLGNLDWNVLVRAGGTVSIYGTQPGWSANAVTVDDCQPMVWASGTAEKLEAQFWLMREAADMALAAIERVKEAKGDEGK